MPPPVPNLHLKPKGENLGIIKCSLKNFKDGPRLLLTCDEVMSVSAQVLQLLSWRDCALSLPRALGSLSSCTTGLTLCSRLCCALLSTLPLPLQLLQEKLGFRFRSVRESFAKYDADMDGSISDTEFRNSRE